MTFGDELLTLLGWAIVFSTSTIVVSALGWVAAFITHANTNTKNSWANGGAVLGFMLPTAYLWWLAAVWAYQTIT